MSRGKLRLCIDSTYATNPKLLNLNHFTALIAAIVSETTIEQMWNVKHYYVFYCLCTTQYNLLACQSTRPLFNDLQIIFRICCLITLSLH